MGRNKDRVLTKRQRVVLDELSSGEADEVSVLKKHGVSTVTYREWLGERLFVTELDFRIESAKRQGVLLIARNASKAATTLVKLMKNKNAETSRKACIDIINFGSKSKAEAPKVKPEDESDGLKIDNDTARRILAILAESKRSGK